MNRLLTNILLFLCCNTFAFSNSEMLTVVEQTAGRISFYDTADGKVVGSIKIGSKPHELNISKDNKTAYATNFGLQDYDETIGVAGTSISVIDIPGRVEKFRLYTFDAEDKKDFSNIDKAPHGLELRPPEEKQLYVNTEVGKKILVFDLETRKIIKKFNSSPHTHNLIFSPDGKVLWLMAGADGVIRMNPDTGQVTGTFKMETPVQGLSYIPGYRYIMASGSNEIVLFDPMSLAIYKKFDNLGVDQLLYSAITPDLRYIIAPAVWDSQVIIVDVKTGKVIKRIVTGADPVNVQVSPSGKFAYVSNARGENVAKINLKTFETTNILTDEGPNGIIVSPFSPPLSHKMITIGAPLPLSGKDSSKGREMMFGYELWKLSVERAGGLLIHQQPYNVNIVYLDTRSDESVVGKLTEELIEQYKANILFSTHGSNAYELEKQIAVAKHIFIVPLPQVSPEAWQPNNIASGEDIFVTSNEYSQQYYNYYLLKPSNLSASATASAIELQQALLQTDSLENSSLTKVFSTHSFHTFLDSVLK